MRLYVIFLDVLKVCWRCHSDKGALLHIWWSCSQIRPFWLDVHSTIKQITDWDLHFEPATFLLHHNNIKYKQSLTSQVLNATKTLIPRLWRLTETPGLSDWFHCIDQVGELEELVRTSREIVLVSIHLDGMVHV